MNKNEVKFGGKLPVKAEYENNKQKMENLIPERTDMTPLLEMDWMKKSILTIGKIQLADNNHSDREKVFNKFPNLFKKRYDKRYRDKHPIKTVALSGKTKSETGTTISTRRCQPLEKLIISWHPEKIKDVDEDCFVSPVVLTVKSDTSV